MAIALRTADLALEEETSTVSYDPSHTISLLTIATFLLICPGYSTSSNEFNSHLIFTREERQRTSLE